MKVQELMNPHVWSVHPDETLTEVTRLMWDEDVGCLPVVDEWNHVIGMVTDRDVAMCMHLRGLPLPQLKVADCMAGHVYSCHVTDDIDVAAGSMRLHQIHRMPVVDESERLMGILSLNDMARVTFAHPDAAERRNMTQEVGRTLAAICEPRTRPQEESVVEMELQEKEMAREAEIPKTGPTNAPKSPPKPKGARRHVRG